LIKTPQFAHQKIGTAAFVKNAAFALFDEMGAGKSKQVIDAACTLAEQGKIDMVIAVAPASVRCVWLDKEIGEIKKHAWYPSIVWEYHAKTKRIWEDKWEKGQKVPLSWCVTNYEFLRSKERVRDLLELIAGNKILLVLDESSYVKNRTAAQSKAVQRLRKFCSRCVLLNGTPVTNSPLDLYSQLNILDPKILNEDNFFSFRAKYAVLQQRKMGTMRFQEVVGYKDLDKLAKRVSPYVLRREKKDCLDLPEKLYTTREVALTAESWKRYCELKKDALITLSQGINEPSEAMLSNARKLHPEYSEDLILEIVNRESSVSHKRLEPNAAVRLMRLAQLTSGILGAAYRGYNPATDEFRETDYQTIGSEKEPSETGKPLDLSDEKLRWAVQYLTEECTAKAVIIWTRWRRERERLVQELTDKLPVFELYGGQKQNERGIAVGEFSQMQSKWERRILVAQPHAGGHGLNLIAASEAIYISNDFSLGIRLQSEDRCHRPGQLNAVTYLDVLATGPNGQRTIDHVIFKALRDKKSVADMTTSEWRKELEND
jgi:SNF2 family DNA or RNA helicase